MVSGAVRGTTLLCSVLALTGASTAGGIAVGCTAILDMPEPTLCPDGVCPDASSKGRDYDASTQPAAEAAPPGEATTSPTREGGPPADDAGPPALTEDARAPTPFRCGGAPQTGGTECAPPSLCCLALDGSHEYTCKASCAPYPAAYPIECAGPQDCASGDVCCHFHRATVCIPEYLPDGAPYHCLDGTHGGDVVCDPGGPVSQCPTGSCDNPLGSDNAYYGCWPPPI